MLEKRRRITDSDAGIVSIKKWWMQLVSTVNAFNGPQWETIIFRVTTVRKTTFRVSGDDELSHSNTLIPL